MIIITLHYYITLLHYTVTLHYYITLLHYIISLCSTVLRYIITLHYYTITLHCIVAAVGTEQAVSESRGAPNGARIPKEVSATPHWRIPRQ